jgi:DNA-binding transcriptional LysR family regulator
MDTRLLRLFVACSRLGSFAAVADQEGVPPSTVSRAIAALEQEMQARLLNRTTRSMSLTEAGETLLPVAERILSDLEATRDGLRATPGGRVRISASVAFGEAVLIPLLPGLRAALPDVSLDVVLTDARLDLAKEGIDLALRHGAEVGEDAVAARVGETRYILCAAPEWVARHGMPEGPAAVTRLDCLRYGLPGLRDHWVFGEATAQTALAVSGTLDISSPSGVKAAALAGMGPAVLAHWLVRADLAEGRLVDLMPRTSVRPGATADRSGIWLVYPSRDYLPDRVRRTLDHLAREIRAVTRN